MRERDAEKESEKYIERNRNRERKRGEKEREKQKERSREREKEGDKEREGDRMSFMFNFVNFLNMTFVLLMSFRLRTVNKAPLYLQGYFNQKYLDFIFASYCHEGRKMGFACKQKTKNIVVIRKCETSVNVKTIILFTEVFALYVVAS